MPLFNKKEPTPAPRSSFGGILKESLFGSRPTVPKPEQKPQPKPQSPGLFGKEGYSSFSQQRGFAREEAPFAPLPGTSRPIGKEERVGLIKKLEERAKKAGQTFGLSEGTFRERILPQMKREKYQLHIKREFGKEKQLEREIQQYEKWIKGV